MRLRKEIRKRNVLTYDGTLLDRLALSYVRRIWKPAQYELVCAVRPCMHGQLQGEVADFALRHRCPLAGFNGDCIVDKERGVFRTVRCGNITPLIQEAFSGSGGLLISTAVLSDWSKTMMVQVNETRQSYRFVNGLALARPGCRSMAEWETLFLFEGLEPLDLVAAYVSDVQPVIQQYWIPRCYLCCFNERVVSGLQQIVASLKGGE